MLLEATKMYDRKSDVNKSNNKKVSTLDDIKKAAHEIFD